MEALLERWSIHMAHTKACNGMDKICVLIQWRRRKHGARCRVIQMRLEGGHLQQVAEKVKIEIKYDAGVTLLDHSLREDKTW